MRKAQIKMGENIAILFIFFLLLAFGGIFYMRVQKTSAAKLSYEKFQARAVEISQKISYLPEFTCTNDNVRVDSCIDRLKAESFSSHYRDNIIYYYDLFGYSRVRYIEVFPGESVIELYVNEPDNVESAEKSSLPVPAVLYDANSSIYKMGYLLIEVYR